MKSIFAATAILSEAALQAAAIHRNLPPSPGREFSGNCVVVVNCMATSGGGRVHLSQRNGNVGTRFGLGNFIITPAITGGGFGTRILTPDRVTLVVSDECPAFNATQGTTVSYTGKIIPGVQQ